MTRLGRMPVQQAHVLETDIPPRLDRLPWSGWHVRIVVALGITWLLDGLEGGIGGSLSGALKQHETLGLTDAQLGLSSTFYLAGTVVGALVFGYLADRFGRRKLFLWTLAVYVCATTATACSWNLLTFTICRTLTGAGIGGEYSAITSAVDELIPARIRGTVDLVINSTFWIGVVLGSLVAVGFLSPHVFGLRLGWRLSFFAGLPIAVVVLFLRRHLPESPRWLLTHGDPDEAEQVTREIEEQVRAHKGPLTRVNTSVSVERGTHDLLRNTMHLFTGRHRSRAWLCLGLMVAQSFFYNSVFFSSTLVLLRFYGVSAQHAGYLFLPIALTNFLGPALLSRLVDTMGRRIVIATTFCLTGVTFAMSSTLFYAGRLSMVSQVAWWAVAFFFAASAAGSAYLTTSELFPQQVRATAISFFYAAGTLFGGVMGPAVFGVLLNSGARAPIFYGYMASAAAMVLAGVAQAIWGVAAEGKALEDL